MAELAVVAHLPLLCITQDTIDCGTFSLWRMPFEVFDNLSQGAFTDHRAEYGATAPVFLRVDTSFEAGDGLIRRLRAPVAGAFESKVPTALWGELPELRLGFVLALHETLVDRFSAALALAAPASLLPPARWSGTFAQVDEEHSFVQGTLAYGSLRVQGDADLEYLFAPFCTGGPVETAVIEQAVDWIGLVDFAAKHEELAAALQALRSAAAPSLSLDDQSLLCSVALEALLLPEVRSGLEQVFAIRSSNLPGVEDAAAVREAAAVLYDARSAGLHGAALARDASAAVARAYAAQLLAAAIVGLAHGLRAGHTLEELRAQLDAGPVDAFAAPRWRLQDDPPGLRARDRISPPVARHPVIVRNTSAGVQPIAGAYACYAPLTGLGCTAVQPLGEPPCPVLIPLSGSEVVSLEDRDIARDYLSELHQVPEQIAALGLFIPDASVSDDHQALRALRRQRELAVASLRLAGFDGFVDPELAGLHVLHDKRPLREPSVLRQTVLTRLRNEPARTVEAADRQRTLPAWELVKRYATSTTHPEIERWLGAFRRLHDRDFLPPAARANLGFALVEGLLGRFRPPDDPMPLEAFVTEILEQPGDPAALWFSQHGRTWRNALAHGRLQTIDDRAPLEHLLVIARAALGRAIALWLDAGDPKRRPAKLLIRDLSTRIEARAVAE